MFFHQIFKLLWPVVLVLWINSKVNDPICEKIHISRLGFFRQENSVCHLVSHLKPAGIYVSHRFRSAYVRIVCTNRNFIYKFNFCIRLLNSTAQHHTILQGKILFRRKILINKKGKKICSSFFCIRLSNSITKRRTKIQDQNLISRKSIWKG